MHDLKGNVYTILIYKSKRVECTEENIKLDIRIILKSVLELQIV